MIKPSVLAEERINHMRAAGFMQPVDPVFAKFYKRHKAKKGAAFDKITLPSGRVMTMAECNMYSLREQVKRASARYHGLLMEENDGDGRTGNLSR